MQRPSSPAQAMLAWTLFIRGLAVLAVALIGFRWPQHMLLVAMAIIGPVLIVFAVSDLVVWLVLARSGGPRRVWPACVLAVLGLTFGALTLVMPSLSLTTALYAAVLWLLLAGSTVIAFSLYALPVSRSRSVGLAWGFAQLVIVVLLASPWFSNTTALLYIGAVYAVMLGATLAGLGLWLHRTPQLPVQSWSARGAG